MSLSCLKKTVGFFAFIVALAGIAVIVVMSILLADNGSTALWQASGINFGEALTIGTLVIGILLFLLGIQGIYGGCKRNRCCLTFYQFGIILICTAFIALGVCSSIYFAEFSDDVQTQIDINNQYCSYDKFNAIQCNAQCGKAASLINSFYSINNDINLAGTYFGHDVNCQIFSQNDSITSQINDYTLKTGPYQITQDKTNGNINVENCKSEAPNNIRQAINSVSGLMAFLEPTFQCSGMCQPYTYFMFSNVNSSPQNLATKPCFNAIQTFLNDYSLEIQLVSYITGGVLFLNIILVFVLCCKKEKKGGNIYTRMDYLDE